jgi:hypothetical protein
MLADFPLPNVLDEAIISEPPKQPHALTLGTPIEGKI